MTECKILTPRQRRKLLRCVECGEKPTKLGWSDEIYPDEPFMHGLRVLLCDCGAFSLCKHKLPATAGAPANKATKVLRRDAYEAAMTRIGADPVTRAMEADAALLVVRDFLSATLGVKPSAARFDRMSADTAARAIEVLT